MCKPTSRFLLPVAVLLIAAIGFTACTDQGDDKPQSASSTAPVASASSTPGATSPTATTTPLVTATTSPSPTIPPDRATYTDAAYGYSFAYPASWFLTQAAEPVLRSYDPATVPSAQAGMPVPKDKLKALFRIQEGVNEPVEQWLVDSREGQPPVTVISTSDVVLGGRTGLVQVTNGDGGESTGYYIPLGNGRLFIIGAGPSDSDVWPEFQAVLDSLKFAP